MVYTTGGGREEDGITCSAGSADAMVISSSNAAYKLALQDIIDKKEMASGKTATIRKTTTTRSAPAYKSKSYVYRTLILLAL